MPTEVALIGDSHIPTRSDEIPGWVAEKVEEADLCIHTGDFENREGLREVERLHDDLVAVVGNMDKKSSRNSEPGS